MNDERVVVHILTGYLGSGKTTLLNRLLRSPDMHDAAVIVNEFGEVGIDHALVQASSDGVVLLSSGCLCCTVRGDLLATLSDLAAARRAGTIPGLCRVVIETTGLADPAPILQGLLSDYAAVSDYRIGRVITVVDALHGWRTLDERFEAVRQAALADVLVVSKTDLADSGATQQLRGRLAALNPVAQQLCVLPGETELTRLLGGTGFELSARSPQARGWVEEAGHHARHHDHHHDQRVRAHCLTWDEPQDWSRIAAGLDRLVVDHGEQLLRVKGLVNVAGQQEPVVIQGVRNMFHAPSTLAAWPDEDRRTRLVFIAEGLERADIEQSIARGAREGVGAVEI